MHLERGLTTLNTSRRKKKKFTKKELVRLEQLRKENNKFFLPRIFNYFDDIVGTEIELYNDYTGERLAIKEFNDENKDIKISPCYNLICQKYTLYWYHQIFITHIKRS